MRPLYTKAAIHDLLQPEVCTERRTQSIRGRSFTAFYSSESLWCRVRFSIRERPFTAFYNIMRKGEHAVYKYMCKSAIHAQN